MTIEITELPGGLRVVTEAMPHLETVSLGVWIGAGSRHESDAEQGLSHLLEHMAFKGTHRRSARAINEEIEAVGGDLNAATGVEQTAYYAHVLAGDAPLALDILADILTQSTFAETDLEREKGVILQEIGAVEDTPDDLVHDLFGAAAYADQPIGRAILGTPESVAGFTRDTVGAYLGRHYRAPATIVAAAGRVEHARICDEAAARFAALEGGAEPAAPAPAPARYTGGEQRLRRRLEQAQIMVGWQGLAYTDPGHYALQVFANAVGGGASSRLYADVREERGLCYAINAFHWTYADTGLLGFYAATGARDVPELMAVSLDAVAQAAHDLTEAEIGRAKAQMKVSLLAALESPGARAEQVARQLLAFGRVLPRDEVVAAIEGLDVAAVRAAGARALASPATVAAIGPVAKVLRPDQVGARIAGHA